MLDISIDDGLVVATRAARQARDTIRAHLKRFDLLDVQDKGSQGRDLVTKADLESEREIIRMLKGTFPLYAFHGEETHAKGARVDPERPTWLVDPIDGTTNFAGGIPMSAVSIGLCYQGASVLGVVADIGHDDLYLGSRDGLATRSGRTMRVSRRIDLREALIGFDWPHKDETRQRHEANIAYFLRHGRNVRVLGSAVLSLCAVACGALDAYVNWELFPWDVGAAASMIKSAGGKITSANGEPWTPESTSIVATNGRVHDEILAVLNNS